jgi:hypothetical protein
MAAIQEKEIQEPCAKRVKTEQKIDLTTLARAHPHPRDAEILFDEPSHVYSLRSEPCTFLDAAASSASCPPPFFSIDAAMAGSCSSAVALPPLVSVTTLNHQFFEEFDADRIITKMMLGRDWKNSPYFGQTREQIKDEWERNRKEAADLGTQMHSAIEHYYNAVGEQQLKQVRAMLPESPEFQQFFLKDFLRDWGHLKPFRTEWRIWDAESRVAGSIDMVFCDPLRPGWHYIFDWKRNKKIDPAENWRRYGKPPLDGVLDTNYWHHALQLSVYQEILERVYGFKISGRSLICLYPANQSYQKFDVPYLGPQVKALLAHRRAQWIADYQEKQQQQQHQNEQNQNGQNQNDAEAQGGGDEAGQQWPDGNPFL